GQFFARDRQDLIEQRNTVAQGAIAQPCQTLERGSVGGDAFFFADIRQPARDLIRGNGPEVESLAAALNSGRHLLRIGRGENKFDVRRRLLQRLEQRIEGAGREHVHFVDDV